MLENNITDVLDLTFTEESDYFGKKELVELKPGGKDIRSAQLLAALQSLWLCMYWWQTHISGDHEEAYILTTVGRILDTSLP